MVPALAIASHRHGRAGGDGTGGLGPQEGEERPSSDQLVGRVEGP